MAISLATAALGALIVAATPAAGRAQAIEPGGLLTFECSQLPPPPPPELTAYMRAVLAARAANKPLPTPRTAQLALAGQWQKQSRENDYLQLCKYDAANKSLAAPTPARVVFMGDSITEGWAGDIFSGDRVNRGISGQTTSQMLGRFYADVIALRPSVVHILGGTNDVAGNAGPTNLAMTQNNIKAMTDLAQAHRIRVVLGTIPPAKRIPWRVGLEPAPSIAALNAWIHSYGREKGVTVIDYFAALDDGTGGFSRADSEDGVHPTRAGYAKMEAIAKSKLHGISR